LCSAIVSHIINQAYKKGIVFLDLEEFRYKNYTNSPSIDPASIDSILYTEGKTMSIYSDAVIRLLINLEGIYKFFGYLLKTIPKRYRDDLYKIIAKNRYRIFGNTNCHTI
jgi:predicted DCC family thiol-disulfide oxidoreductase YuxK